MLTVKSVRIFIIVVASVYIGTLLALLAYSLISPLIGGPYSIVKDYFSSFVSLIVWSGSSLMVGSFIDNKTKKAHLPHNK